MNNVRKTGQKGYVGGRGREKEREKKANKGFVQLVGSGTKDAGCPSAVYGFPRCNYFLVSAEKSLLLLPAGSFYFFIGSRGAWRGHASVSNEKERPAREQRDDAR